MLKSPQPIFNPLFVPTILLNSFESALEAVYLITDAKVISEKTVLSHFEEGNADFIEGLDTDAISIEDKLSGLQIALTKRQSTNDSFDKIIQKLSTFDDLIIRVCEDKNLEHFNALTDNGNRKLTPDQISKIIDRKDSEGRQIFNSNFIKKNSDFFKAMVNAGMQNSLTVKDDDKTVLHKAIIDQDLDLANVLIQAGGKDLLNSQDKDGRTALHYACIKGNFNLAEALIRAGGKELLNAQDKNGRTALHEACAKEDLNFAKALIEARGKDLLNSQDKDGKTALHYACLKGNFNLADKLIEAGGKELLNAKDKDGRTALHNACSNSDLINKRIEFINKLIENPDLEFCKDSQDIPYNASDHIKNQILAVENIVLLKIFQTKTTETTTKFYFSGMGLAENLQAMTFLYSSAPKEVLSGPAPDADLSGPALALATRNDPKPRKSFMINFKSCLPSFIGGNSSKIDPQSKVIKNITALTSILDPDSKKLILKYPIDDKLIKQEKELIDQLKQLQTKLIKKEKGEEKYRSLAQKKPSPKTKPVSCWSMLSSARFSSSSNSLT